MVALKQQVEAPVQSAPSQQITLQLTNFVDATLAKDFKDLKLHVNHKHIIKFIDRCRRWFILAGKSQSAGTGDLEIPDWMTQPSSLREQVRPCCFMHR
jgi:hypothetical protein